MSITPYLTSLFLLEILVIVVLGSVFLFGAIYVVREGRSIERGRVAARDDPRDEEAVPLPETEFYYLRTGRERNAIDMKVRLYSLEDYGRELSRSGEATRSDGFVGVLKPYVYHADHWYEMPCEQAISCLGLKAEECEVDEDCGMLLLRTLPKGFSGTAREKFDRPEDLQIFAPEDRSSRSVSALRKEHGG